MVPLHSSFGGWRLEVGGWSLEFGEWSVMEEGTGSRIGPLYTCESRAAMVSGLESEGRATAMFEVEGIFSDTDFSCLMFRVRSCFLEQTQPYGGSSERFDPLSFDIIASSH
jgi:hypothetical protein